MSRIDLRRVIKNPALANHLEGLGYKIVHCRHDTVVICDGANRACCSTQPQENMAYALDALAGTEHPLEDLPLLLSTPIDDSLV